MTVPLIGGTTYTPVYSVANDTNTGMWFPGADTIAWSEGGAERMRLNSYGNLGIGTSSITSGNKLQVNGKVQASYYETTANSSKFKGGGFYGNASIMAMGYSDVSTYNMKLISFTNLSGDEKGHINIVGNSTFFNTSSDERLKENIQDAEDAGAKIDAIRIRQFDWKEGGSHEDYGIIAQELIEVAPEAISGDADSDDMMSVDYSKLVPTLVKEIQSLRNRVEELENL
jgi:hypothetical protein